MANEKETFDAMESLRVIRQTIDLAKQSAQENGFHFLLWGVLVSVAALVDWYLENILQDPKHYRAWLIMVAIGVPAAVIYEWRQERTRSSSSTLLNKWYGLIWLGFGISLLIGIFTAVQHGMNPVPLVLILAAFATFLSGVVLQFKPLYYGAAALWLGAVVCLFLPAQHHSLVESIGILLGYVVPGLMLNRQNRR